MNLTDIKQKPFGLENKVNRLIELWEEMRKWDAEYKKHGNSGAWKKSNDMKPKIDLVVREIKSRQIDLL